jgi:outer membrane receptor protein involved in Fe transport
MRTGWLRRAAWRCILFELATRTVSAQTIDYGALEQLFDESVTTSATGSPQRASDAPTNLRIINADEIRRSGADNIPDILRFVAGLDVRSYAFDSANVAVRGYNQQFSGRLLVLINGRQVYSDIYGYTLWDSLPVQLAEIRQIEVVKGPNSALFGFNAVGGVVNIVTFDPLLDSRDDLTVDGGTQSDRAVSGVATVHIGSSAGLRLSGNASEAHELSTAGLPPTFPQLFANPWRRAASADARVALTSSVVLSAEATVSNVKYAQAIPGPSFSTAFQKSNSFKLGVSAITGIGLLNVSAYRNSLEYPNGLVPAVPIGSPGPPGPGGSSGSGGSLSGGALGTATSVVGINSTGSNALYVVQANDSFKLAAQHAIRVGLEYRDNSADVPDSGGKIAERVYAGSAMWSWQIAPAWALTNSVRFDHMIIDVPPQVSASPTGIQIMLFPSVSVSQPSFNSGLEYQATADDTVRITAARGTQTPSLLDFGLQTSSAGSAPAPKPATIRNYELHYDRKIRPWAASWSMSLFYQQTDNLVANLLLAPSAMQAVSGGGGTGVVASSAFNLGHSAAFGGETTLKGLTPFGLRWTASYARITITGAAGAMSAGSPPSYPDFPGGTPTDVLIGGIGYDWGKVELDAQARWQSGFTDFLPSAGGGSMPWPVHAYATLNARVGYRLMDQLTVALSSQQINESRQFQTAGPAVERRVLLSLSWRP